MRRARSTRCSNASTRRCRPWCSTPPRGGNATGHGCRRSGASATPAGAGAWNCRAPGRVAPRLERCHAPLPALLLDAAAWWERDWARLPAQRRERDASRRWSLELQVAGPLEPRLDHLLAQGWEVQPQADWTATLGL